jgi:hypothetical protein
MSRTAISYTGCVVPGGKGARHHTMWLAASGDAEPNTEAGLVVLNACAETPSEWVEAATRRLGDQVVECGEASNSTTTACRGVTT